MQWEPYQSVVVALAWEPWGRRCGKIGTVCEPARARGQGHVYCQPTVSQALCWALYGDSPKASAIVINN